MRKNCARKGEEGQSTVEFALTAVLIMGFLLFYIQLALSFAWSNYVQYATFMSARAYLSAGASQADQDTRARRVLSITVKKGTGREGEDRFPMIAKGLGGAGGMAGADIGAGSNFDPSVRGLSWMEGVRYTFRSKLFVVPFAGSGRDPSVNSVTLTSESWLGREPSFSDCLREMNRLKGMIDNGC